MTLAELRQKDVINTRDGRCLGRVMDIEFCSCDVHQPGSGRVTAIIAPGAPKSAFRIGCWLRGEQEAMVIPWENICKIGGDVILVDVPELC